MRSRLGLGLALLSAAAIVSPTSAQTIDPSGAQRVQGTGPANRGDPVNVRITQDFAHGERFQLTSANVPSAAVVVQGGNYVWSQTCTAYGTHALRYIGPDGTTQIVLLSKTSSDTANGTALQLGAGATISTTVSGTTACYSVLARVPG